MFLDISNNIKYYVWMLLFSVIVCRENDSYRWIGFDAPCSLL